MLATVSRTAPRSHGTTCAPSLSTMVELNDLGLAPPCSDGDTTTHLTPSEEHAQARARERLDRVLPYATMQVAFFSSMSRTSSAAILALLPPKQNGRRSSRFMYSSLRPQNESSLWIGVAGNGAKMPLIARTPSRSRRCGPRRRAQDRRTSAGRGRARRRVAPPAFSRWRIRCDSTHSR